MKRYLDQLKPQERRWVVAIGVVVFIMLNYFFVWPHFNDWGRDDIRMTLAQKTNELYKVEIRHYSEYTRKINELQSGGESVLPEDQAIDFVHFYSSRAVSNNVVVLSQGQLVTRTNEYFLEQQMGITIQAYETNLVKFLYSLAEGNSMMRVRSMSLHAEPDHIKLSAAITIVASYQKKLPTRSTTTAPAPARTTVAATSKPTPKPATPTLAPAAGAPPVRGAVPPPGDRTNKTAGAFARPTLTNKQPVALTTQQKP